MDIGTAKPLIQEQAGITHHLLDIVEPGEKFSVAEFQKRAKKCVQEIDSRGNVPILVGGTGLYVDSVLYNFHFPKTVDDMRRQTIEQMSDDELTTLMLSKNIDITTLNTKNRRHVVNAILRDGKVGTREPLLPNARIVGLRLERDVLQTRITQRVDEMFEQGFLAEVQQLAERYGWDNEAMSGIGYRVARQYFEGGASEEEAKAAFIQRDLSLAKRQRTWFRRNEDIGWFDDPKDLIDNAIEFVSAFDYNKN
ncbi:tRNA (adenosine(37)-N6)-dimethylallyltransferase MiaA [Candidatus Saccharibacteria bacterium]|nr:tRNA (adenosine(37)-N6)-dimethylallyltransferase MiaA [Candidatus Saccharibacteria bacterium]